MLTNQQIKDRYTEHGLRLIRVSNGLSRSASSEVRSLARDINRLLRNYDPDMTVTQMNAMLREMGDAIQDTFRHVSSVQRAQLNDLMDVELQFSRNILNTKKISIRRRNQMANNVLVHGASVGDQWQRQADNMAWNLSNTVRQARESKTPFKVLRSAVVGEGRIDKELGGLVESTMRNARALIDSSMQSTATTSRIAAYGAPGSGVNAFEWFAILDARVCPNCGLRAGKLYTTDLKPIGHSVALVSSPPLHPFCRCILVPQRFPDGVPKDGGKNADKFEHWLERKSKDEQEDLLGVGRTNLWRKGRISLTELIGQDGLVQTLEELRKAVPNIS